MTICKVNHLFYAARLMNQNEVILLGQYTQQKGDGNGEMGAGVAYICIGFSFQRIMLMCGILLFVFLPVYCALLNENAIKRGNYIILVRMSDILFSYLTAQHCFYFSYNYMLRAYFAKQRIKGWVKQLLNLLERISCATITQFINEWGWAV